MSISIKVKGGKNIPTGELAIIDGNKYLNVGGSIFYPTPNYNGKRSVDPNKGRLTTNDSSALAKSIGKSLEENIYIPVENYQEIIEFMYPERKKVTFVKNYEDFIVHNTGETLVRGEIWINGIGEEKRFETLRREF